MNFCSYPKNWYSHELCLLDCCQIDIRLLVNTILAMIVKILTCINYWVSSDIRFILKFWHQYYVKFWLNLIMNGKCLAVGVVLIVHLMF